MMKQVLVISLHKEESPESTRISFLGQEIQIDRVGCAGDIQQARSIILANDGQVDAIGLEGMPATLQLGSIERQHGLGATLAATARLTPVKDLSKCCAMVIGAMGSIGSVCARMIVQVIYNVVLVSIEPEKLIDLKRRIQQATPGSQVIIATRADELIGDCDLINTATYAFGQRILDITKCKLGVVICDVARPADIIQAESDLRPDVLVIESGEVLIPGDINFGYDIGLPAKTSYACLAETALLAMEGRFEDYTLGRNLSIERVKEIYRLFKKHQFQLAGLRSFGKYIHDAHLEERNWLICSGMTRHYSGDIRKKQPGNLVKSRLWQKALKPGLKIGISGRYYYWALALL